MTTKVCILTSATLDSTPSILLVGPDGNKTLINCGEGCQRSFLEAPGLKVRSVTRVCLTHISDTSIGGLPGMILTTADVAEVAMSNAVQRNQIVKQGKDSFKRTEVQTDDLPGLDIVGPQGTQAFIHSLRHFMRRDRFQIRVHQGAYQQEVKNAAPKVTKKRKRGTCNEGTDGFYIQTIPLKHMVANAETEILSFICRTPPIQGAFLPQKAKELGIPPGPLYGQLKSGKTVSFTKDGVERTAKSAEVVAEGSPGIAVAVIYCPTVEVLSQLKESSILNNARNQSSDHAQLGLVIHITPSDLFHGAEYQEWIEIFAADIEHVWLDTYENFVTQSDRICKYDHGSPFRSAALGSLKRSMIHSGVFPPVLTPRQGQDYKTMPSERETKSSSKIIPGRRLLEYCLIPRSRRGLDKSPLIVDDKAAMTEARQSVAESGAVEKAREILATIEANEANDGLAHVLFTGTGSALPCKHRNVSGIQVRMENGNTLLLDVGEGTVGQLFRVKSDGDSYQDVVDRIHAVWVSHPHADHHLGILRLLSERNAVSRAKPLILMAPPNLFRFLDEYKKVDLRIKDSYIEVDCRAMVAPQELPGRIKADLHQRLGVTSCRAVPVAHCPHSFAVIFDGTAFGRVAYSGDCRPSIQFAEQASKADLLIHEATFEDGMEEEAALKRHCTVGEALMIGRKMRAKIVVLTHFSQRYPRIPPVHTQSMDGPNIPVAFAFDHMRLTPRGLPIAARLTPALRLLYPDESEAAVEGEPKGISAKAIMATPGLFAQSELL